MLWAGSCRRKAGRRGWRLHQKRTPSLNTSFQGPEGGVLGPCPSSLVRTHMNEWSLCFFSIENIQFFFFFSINFSISLVVNEYSEWVVWEGVKLWIAGQYHFVYDRGLSYEVDRCGDHFDPVVSSIKCFSSCGCLSLWFLHGSV